MEIEEALYGRLSIRRFTKELVAMDVVREIVQAGTFAPSVYNMQAWRFIYIDDAEMLKRIAQRGENILLRMAKQAILVLYDSRIENVAPANLDNYMKSIDYRGDIQSAAACMENMCLRAYSLGVGMCWMTLLPSKNELRDMLKIPEGIEVIGILPFGYPQVDESSRQRPRRTELDEILYHNQFGETI